jgi:TRAP-type uncharacterized transport system substrate-binding protein
MKKFALVIALTIAAASAMAQSTFKVSTGGASATYSRMAKEIGNACAADIQLQEINSSGSMQNMDRLTGNEVQGAFVQTDVIKFRGNTEDLSNIKTLVTLHPEQVHLVALAAGGAKEGGVMGIGGKAVVFNTVNDLAGRTVVASGGSYITAQVIRLQTEINFNVVEVADAKAAIEAVNAGTAAAALFVGGQPMDNLKTLNKAHKLLSFPEGTVAKLKNVYKPATVNYTNMGSTGVATVSTDALLVVRQYKTPKMVEALAKFRSCFNTKAPELAETTGTHAAWTKVSVGAESKWPMYELPTVAATKK